MAGYLTRSPEAIFQFIIQISGDVTGTLPGMFIIHTMAVTGEVITHPVIITGIISLFILIIQDL